MKRLDEPKGQIMSKCLVNWISRAEAARLLGLSLYVFDRDSRSLGLLPQRVEGRACPQYRRADVEALAIETGRGQVAAQHGGRLVEFCWSSTDEHGNTYTCSFEGAGKLTMIGPARPTTPEILE
jgi:hypothetical protein